MKTAPIRQPPGRSKLFMFNNMAWETSAEQKIGQLAVPVAPGAPAGVPAAHSRRRPLQVTYYSEASRKMA
jgi:hypothetical protein